MFFFNMIAAAGDDLVIFDYHCANGDLSGSRRRLSFLKCGAHEIGVGHFSVTSVRTTNIRWLKKRKRI